MDNNYSADYVTIIDEDGSEYELEVIDGFTFEDKDYMVFLPADMSEDDEDYGFILLEVVTDENGEELFESIKDDEEEQRVFDYYMEEIFSDDEEE